VRVAARPRPVRNRSRVGPRQPVGVVTQLQPKPVPMTHIQSEFRQM
jgi:hypothetical protein